MTICLLTGNVISGHLVKHLALFFHESRVLWDSTGRSDNDLFDHGANRFPSLGISFGKLQHSSPHSPLPGLPQISA